MILSNSSPLIYLSKLGKLELLKILFKEVIIPKEVLEEVIKKDYSDSLIIEKAVNDGWIKVNNIEIDQELKRFSDMDIGEIALISLAKKLKPNLILIDDAFARTIAENLGFNVKGTLYVLLMTFRKKILNKKETKKLINKLIFSGFRISQELYIEVLEELDKY